MAYACIASLFYRFIAIYDVTNASSVKVEVRMCVYMVDFGITLRKIVKLHSKIGT